MACSHWTDRSNRTGTMGSNGYYGLWPSRTSVKIFTASLLCVILFTEGVSVREYLSGGVSVHGGGGLCQGDRPVRLRAGGTHPTGTHSCLHPTFHLILVTVPVPFPCSVNVPQVQYVSPELTH